MMRRMTGGVLLSLVLAACAGGPEADEAPAACTRMLADSATYLQQHVDAREEKLKVIRFASQADMDDYNRKTASYDTARIDFIAMGNVIEGEHSLPDAPDGPVFDHTTDEEADARITEGKACAHKLLE